jgi:hypothetical protein
MTGCPGARQAFQWPVAKTRLKACLSWPGLVGCLRKNVLVEASYWVGLWGAGDGDDASFGSRDEEGEGKGEDAC